MRTGQVGVEELMWAVTTAIHMPGVTESSSGHPNDCSATAERGGGVPGQDVVRS